MAYSRMKKVSGFPPLNVRSGDHLNIFNRVRKAPVLGV